MGTNAIPYIDTGVEHVGVSRLRKLNSEELRNIKKTMVLQDNDTPLAVLVKYEKFLIMQNQLKALLDTIEVLTNEAENSALKAGLEDLQAGRVKKVSAIRASLKGRR